MTFKSQANVNKVVTLNEMLYNFCYNEWKKLDFLIKWSIFPRNIRYLYQFANHNEIVAEKIASKKQYDNALNRHLLCLSVCVCVASDSYHSGDSETSHFDKSTCTRDYSSIKQTPKDS